MTAIPVTPGEKIQCADWINRVDLVRWRKTTAKQVVNTVTETDLLNGEITIDAGAMMTDRAIRLTAIGDMLNNTGATIGAPRFKFKIGGVTFFDSSTTAAVWGTSTARFPWRAVVEIQNLGATNSQWVSLDMHLGGFFSVVFTVNPIATGEGIYVSDGHLDARFMACSLGAQDTTLAQALALTITLPTANALEDVTLKSALVELL